MGACTLLGGSLSLIRRRLRTRRISSHWGKSDFRLTWSGPIINDKFSIFFKKTHVAVDPEKSGN